MPGPCSSSRLHRLLVACVALRTHLTMRELAAVVGFSGARAMAGPARRATSAGGPGNRNDPLQCRGSKVESLCLEHRRVLADGGYRGVAGLRIPVFRSNRIVRDRAWRRHRRRRARVEHTLARLKDWRVLRDHRRRGRHLAATVAAVAVLHNLRLDLWDSS